MKPVCVVCLMAFGCSAYAKQKVHPMNPCDLKSTFSMSSASNESKAKINAELMALNFDLINPGFDGEFSKTVEDTYQVIREKDVACNLMLQEVQCVVATRPLAIRGNIATALVKIVGQKNVCDSGKLRGLEEMLEAK